MQNAVLCYAHQFSLLMFFELCIYSHVFADYHVSLSLEIGSPKYGLFHKGRMAKGNDLTTVRTFEMSSFYACHSVLQFRMYTCVKKHHLK